MLPRCIVPQNHSREACGRNLSEFRAHLFCAFSGQVPSQSFSTHAFLFCTQPRREASSTYVYTFQFLHISAMQRQSVTEVLASRCIYALQFPVPLPKVVRELLQKLFLAINVFDYATFRGKGNRFELIIANAKHFQEAKISYVRRY